MIVLVCKLKALSEEDLDLFNRSKKFYHFFHSDDVASFQILSDSIQQFNFIVEQHQLIEDSIHEIENRHTLLSISKEDLENKINHFRLKQAAFVAELVPYLAIITRRAHALQSLLEARTGCEDLRDSIHSILTAEPKCHRLISEEEARLMELSSVNPFFISKPHFDQFHAHIEQQASGKVKRRYHRINWFNVQQGQKWVRAEIDHKPTYLFDAIEAPFTKKLTGLRSWFFNSTDRDQLLADQFYRRANRVSDMQQLSMAFFLEKNKLATTEDICSLAFINLLKAAETKLLGFYQTVENERVAGIKAYFFQDKNQALNVELTDLCQGFQELQTLKLNFLNEVLTTFSSQYRHSHFDLIPRKISGDLLTH